MARSSIFRWHYTSGLQILFCSLKCRERKNTLFINLATRPSNSLALSFTGVWDIFRSSTRLHSPSTVISGAVCKARLLILTGNVFIVLDLSGKKPGISMLFTTPACTVPLYSELALLFGSWNSFIFNSLLLQERLLVIVPTPFNLKTQQPSNKTEVTMMWNNRVVILF